MGHLLKKKALAFRIMPPAAPKMRIECSALNKAAERRLIDKRSVIIHNRLQCSKFLKQCWWQHRIREPQGREKGLAEGPDVDDAAMLIQALLAGLRETGVAKLRVIIVFDDP